MTGTTAVRPHAATTRTTTGGATGTTTFSYDNACNTLTYAAKTLTYNADNQLATTTVSSTTENRIYDADGTLLLTTGGSGTQLVLGDTILTAPTGGGPVTATRTYTFNGLHLADGTATTGNPTTTKTFLTGNSQNTVTTEPPPPARSPAATYPLRQTRGTTPTWNTPSDSSTNPPTPPPASPTSAPATTTPPLANSPSSTPSSPPTTPTRTTATTTPPTTPPTTPTLTASATKTRQPANTKASTAAARKHQVRASGPHRSRVPRNWADTATPQGPQTEQNRPGVCPLLCPRKSLRMGCSFPVSSSLHCSSPHLPSWATGEITGDLIPRQM